MRSIAIKGVVIASGFWERFLGLMAASQWPMAHKGLYFLDCRSLHTFFMVLRPDILFLDKSRKILRIVPSAVPWRVFLGPVECRHCLELPEGTARRSKLRVGDIVRF